MRNVKLLAQFFDAIGEGYSPPEARRILGIKRDHMERLGAMAAMMFESASDRPGEKQRPDTESQARVKANHIPERQP